MQWLYVHMQQQEDPMPELARGAQGLWLRMPSMHVCVITQAAWPARASGRQTLPLILNTPFLGPRHSHQLGLFPQ